MPVPIINLIACSRHLFVRSINRNKLDDYAPHFEAFNSDTFTSFVTILFIALQGRNMCILNFVLLSIALVVKAQLSTNQTVVLTSSFNIQVTEYVNNTFNDTFHKYAVKQDVTDFKSTVLGGGQSHHNISILDVKKRPQNMFQGNELMRFAANEVRLMIDEHGVYRLTAYSNVDIVHVNKEEDTKPRIQLRIPIAILANRLPKILLLPLLWQHKVPLGLNKKTADELRRIVNRHLDNTCK
ncbi:hypothetical protein M422DRAFT_54765 [Sphaerobolus stellatus SS14]|uniref:Uncharacterized protein n=1 Tax=Sphaerobolus stellatus (strain SS14) TaxID=990650 RepID=A0A0C9TFH0_SPHS4|nr:hypothetical protein M422DRAFT_54765 [Sphaerobolus stellatus SS14]